MSTSGDGLTDLSLTTANRLVVKIGSKLIADEDSHQIRYRWLTRLAADIACCRARGQEVIVVTSGAVALGRGWLNLPQRILRLDEKQAAAACGQVTLVESYRHALASYHIPIAQVLLSFADTEERRRHLNARATISTLLQLGVVPVINENDTVATDEIRFGDNDRLAARVAQMMSADTLVLLSDIDGLYTHDPRKHSQARLIPVVRRLTEQIIAMGGNAPGYYSSGGMVTKLEAARICVNAGCRMVIAKGEHKRPLCSLDPQFDATRLPATWFLPGTEPLTARKRWIVAHLSTCGLLTVDDGARAALAAGKSLLPAGVLVAEGEFQRGDLVAVQDRQKLELARGLISHDARDARRILGLRSGDIQAMGYHGRKEIIHRDDLVWLADSYRDESSAPAHEPLSEASYPGNG